MPFLEPELGDFEAVLILAFTVVAVLWLVARTRRGGLVGTMHVTEWSIRGIRDHVALTVRRRLIGAHGMREARIVVGQTARGLGRPRQAEVETLTEEEAREAALLLERAAEASGG